MLKPLLCRVAFALGGVRLCGAYANWRRGHPLRILSIHRVIDTARPLTAEDERDLARGILSRAEFERRIRFIGQRYRFVDIAACGGWLKNGEPLPANALALTFDDGFSDIHSAAWPILAGMRVPFAVMLTTGHVGRSNMLSRQQIGEMAAGAERLVTWGAHGVTHRPLTEIAPEEAEAEIARSKAEVEEMTGAKAAVFAYPDGKHDAQVRSLVEKHGFDAALATGRTLNWAPFERYALKRIPFENEPLTRFAFRLAGMA
jgi:peptidoglycan/xylan/chitin deacetylase (PgdA/CDA1 family)